MSVNEKIYKISRAKCEICGNDIVSTHIKRHQKSKYCREIKEFISDKNINYIK